MILLQHASNTEAIMSTTISPACISWGCKLNFTLPAAGCLGPPGSAECQLLIGWQNSVTVSSRTVCSDLCLCLADSHKQSLSHPLWVTLFATVEFVPCEQEWRVRSLTMVCVCVCVSAQMHAQCWHLIGKERQSIYFSLLNSTQRDGISHQSWLSHRPRLPHARSHT